MHTLQSIQIYFIYCKNDYTAVSIQRWIMKCDEVNVMKWFWKAWLGVLFGSSGRYRGNCWCFGCRRCRRRWWHWWRWWQRSSGEVLCHGLRRQPLLSRSDHTTIMTTLIPTRGEAHINIHYLLISRRFLHVFLQLSFQSLLWIQTRGSGGANPCGCRFLALPFLSTEKDEKIKSKWTQILTSQEPSRALTPVSPSRADSPLPSRADSRLDSPLTDSPLATQTGMCNTVPCVEHEQYTSLRNTVNQYITKTSSVFHDVFFKSHDIISMCVFKFFMTFNRNIPACHDVSHHVSPSDHVLWPAQKHPNPVAFRTGKTHQNDWKNLSNRHWTFSQWFVALGKRHKSWRWNGHVVRRVNRIGSRFCPESPCN